PSCCGFLTRVKGGEPTTRWVNPPWGGSPEPTTPWVNPPWGERPERLLPHCTTAAPRHHGTASPRRHVTTAPRHGVRVDNPASWGFFAGVSAKNPQFARISRPVGGSLLVY